MANKKLINKDNPKNIYCAHCKHFAPTKYTMVCKNPNSKHFEQHRCYYHRCKNFEWEDTEDGK